MVGVLALASCTTASVVPARDARPVDLGGRMILVAGGSGRVGSFLIEELRTQGLSFRATTRSLDEARQRLGERAEGVSWVETDVRDATQAAAAVAGADMVISVIGSNQVSGPNGPEFVDYGGVVNLVDAAVREGVQHFVLLTAIGVTDPAHPFNKATKGALQYRYLGEQHLRRSGLRYTIVRPGGLVNSPAGRAGLRIEQGDNWKPLLRSTLSRADLALLLIECLRNPGAANATFEVVNDPALPPDAWLAAPGRLLPDGATSR